MLNLKLQEIVNRLTEKQYDLPILSETFIKFEKLYKEKELDQDIFEVLNIILNDPLLSLKLLFKISTKRRMAMELEINSMKKALMILGFKEFFEIVFNSSVMIRNEGFDILIKRSQYASEKAKRIAIERNDVLPEEVQLTTLLADLGELILWIYESKVPEEIMNAMMYGRYKRNQEAQLSICGYRFKDLSYELAKRWNLPSTIIKLIENNIEERSVISKICINLSRHLYEKKGYLAVPDDIKELKKQTFHSVKELYNLLEIDNNLSEEECIYIKKEIKLI